MDGHLLELITKPYGAMEDLYQPALTTTHAPICGVRWS
jgi:hypothetical protein